MVDIISLAHGVAERIGDAEVELAPEYSLKDVKEKTRIVVVPVGIKHRMLARGFREDFLTIHVGVLRKTTEDELVDLVNYAQTLALDFLHTTVRGAKLAVGRKVEEVIALLKGIPCRNGTSCPDQLARALEREIKGSELLVGG